MTTPLQELPKVFVIVLNYNGARTITPCLTSVLRLDYPNFETIVVDNDSRDGSFEEAKRLYPKAHFIRNGRNAGFAAGNNVAIRFALEKMADFVLLLNNDAVIHPDAITKLVDTARSDPHAGILSPLIFGPDGKTVWFAGGKIDWLRMRSSHIRTRPASDIPFASDFITGCAMFLRSDLFRKVGLLEENYFLYYEDADMSVRAKKAGYGLLVVPTATVTHFETSEADSAGKTYWLVLSGIIFFLSHTPAILKPWTKCYLAGRKIKNFIDMKKSPNHITRAVRQAYTDYGKPSTR